jgi:V/A-type H+-transporting ATPase subunit K
MELGIALGVIGAVIAFGLSGAGCGIAMGMVGQAAAGVVAEDPRKFGQTLVLQAVGSTSGIYGLLIGFLILNKAMEVTDTSTGLYLLASGIPMGVVGLVASIGQGRALASGVILIGKKSAEMAKALIYAAMVETMQIFGLLLSFLIYNNV